jgi:hypothetical protein
MEKQTPVEFLFEQLWETPKDKFTWNAILEKAKEMEEKALVKAASRGYLQMPENFNLEDAKEFGQQYYDNCFKTK